MAKGGRLRLGRASDARAATVAGLYALPSIQGPRCRNRRLAPRQQGLARARLPLDRDRRHADADAAGAFGAHAPVRAQGKRRLESHKFADVLSNFFFYVNTDAALLVASTE